MALTPSPTKTTPTKRSRPRQSHDVNMPIDPTDDASNGPSLSKATPRRPAERVHILPRPQLPSLAGTPSKNVQPARPVSAQALKAGEECLDDVDDDETQGYSNVAEYDVQGELVYQHASVGRIDDRVRPQNLGAEVVQAMKRAVARARVADAKFKMLEEEALSKLSLHSIPVKECGALDVEVPDSVIAKAIALYGSDQLLDVTTRADKDSSVYPEKTWGVALVVGRHPNSRVEPRDLQKEGSVCHDWVYVKGETGKGKVEAMKRLVEKVEVLLQEHLLQLSCGQVVR
ncbi:hypothetical protein LTS18_012188 [Coniosporium uncinatum]|uniref:Uncharacterized protein n=1 Tax=Coniosporium uncinatum TaxID=93489 RepID=A0ACC3DVT9_9PEZI|nr:hypothetical protein LTS18_012188 [Coniosporium uncinatum]